MSGFGSTGMKMIAQLEEAYKGLVSRLTVVESATDDALRGSAEALQGVAEGLAAVEDLEVRVQVLEAYLGDGGGDGGPVEPGEPDPDEPDEPDEPPAEEPYLTVIQPELVADLAGPTSGWRAEEGYARAIGEPGDHIVIAFRQPETPVERYEVWARVYGYDGGSDAFLLTAPGRTWRVFPRTPGVWQTIAIGSFSLEGLQPNTNGDYEIGFTVQEKGACVDAVIVSGKSLTNAEALSLLGQEPMLPGKYAPSPLPEPGTGEPEPVPGTRAFGFTPDDSFDPDKPVINGKRLEGEALVAWKGVAHLIRNYGERRWVEKGKMADLASRDSAYHYGREKGQADNELFVVYALTGWKAALDELVRFFQIQRDELAVGYRTKESGYDASKVRMPPAPQLGWGWGYSSGAQYIGTNYHPMDSAKTFTPIARLIYALDNARGHVSPAGFDYGKEADIWRDLFREHFIPMWAGPERGGLDGWSKNYKGGQHKYYHGKSSTQRMGTNGLPMMPFFNRHHVHTHSSDCALVRYIGLTMPEFEEGVEIGEDGLHTLLIQRNAFYFEGKYGEAVAIPRSLHETGHGTLKSPSNNYIFPVTYYGYVISEMMLAFLDGWFPDFGERFARPSVNLMTEYAVPSTPRGYGLPGDLTSNRMVRGRNLEGGTLEVHGAYDYTNDFSQARSYTAVMMRGYPHLLAFDPDGSYEAQMLKVFTGNGAHSDSMGTNPMERPRMLSYNLGKLMKLTGVFG